MGTVEPEMGWFRRALQSHSQLVLSVILPTGLMAVILVADLAEGPKTAYVGVLTAIPLLSAVFGTPRITAGISVLTWVSAFTFGQLASDGNVRAQGFRLAIIAIFGVIAVVAAVVRTRLESQLSSALMQAAQTEALRVQAHSDSLTGLLNRRGIIERFEELRSEKATLAMIDIDQLKSINDSHGHIVGDEIIIAAGSRIAAGVSRTDVVGRWGGDEFVVILELELGRGASIIERLFHRVSSAPVATTIGDLPFGISVGVSEWVAGETLEIVLARADAALYAAKDAGRSRFIVA